MTAQTPLQKEFEDLKRWRDELKVQAHLGKAEALDTLDKLKQAWPQVEARVQAFEKASQDAFEGLAAAATDVMHDVQSHIDGYRDRQP